MMDLVRITAALALAGCMSTSASPPPSGAVEQSLEAAATEAGVPPELVVAIAVEEGGVARPAIRLVDADENVPTAGMLELRRGRLDTLALGARLIGTSVDAIRADTELGTRAGARVLAELGAQYGADASLASWRRALEVMAGMDDQMSSAYASRVLELVRTGGEFPARDGERVRIAAHPELPAENVARVIAPAAPEFPGAQWFTTSCTDKCTVGRPLGHASVNKIVIHDTEGNWDGSVATLQYDPAKSVHYIIDADGSRVGQFRSENDTTWHGGNYYYNETSIGIEHVGVAANAAGYSPALYAKSRQLVQSIRTRWSVPLDRSHIIGHYQIPDGTVISESSAPCTGPLDTCETSSQFGGAQNHRDPGYYWQWCQYMEALGGSCTCNDAWDHWNCTSDKTEAVRCHAGQVEIAHCATACSVQPVGVDDVCMTDDGGGNGSGSGSGSDGQDRSGFPPDTYEPLPDDGSDPGGCATTRGPGSLLALGVALLALRRRRR